DGVNIAARVQGEAAVNSICISDSVYRNIKNRPEFETRFLEKKQLKNIEEPIGLYEVQLKQQPIPPPQRWSDTIGELATRPLTLGLTAVLLMLALAYVLWPVGNSTVAPSATTEKSIAVLPFRNDSPQPGESQYFCNGVMEGIRNNLSKIKALQVVSRRSVEQFKDSQLSIADIAKALNVSYILEGSVQRHDNQIRIYSQLWEGTDEREIWSERYDRNTSDILALESEVSEQIASELSIQLAPNEQQRIQSRPTNDVRAYDQYLLASEIHGRYRQSREAFEFDNALRTYNKALDIDPSFAQVYASVAQLYYDRDYAAGYFSDNWLDTIPVLCERSIALNPELDTPYYLLGLYYKEKNQWERSQQYYEKALALNPNFAEAMLDLGQLYQEREQPVKALAMLDNAAQLDRGDVLPVLYDKIASIYYTMGDFDHARQYLEKQLMLKPNNFGPLFWFEALQGNFAEAKRLAEKEYQLKPQAIYSIEIMALSHMYLREYQDAEKYFRQWIEKLEAADSGHLTNRLRNRYGFVLSQNGKPEEAQQQFDLNRDYLLRALDLERALSTSGAGLYDLAATAAYLGETEAALSWLHQFARYGWNWGSAYFIEVDPLFDKLRANDRYRTIVRDAQDHKARLRQQLELLN
ncbi:MAG: tetratricopeptide repeat protein, partial [Bacteroidota bacterium]